MIRLTNYIEAYLQMQLYAEKNGGELKELLPAAITDLTEACEGYMHAIRLPSDAEDHLALLEHKAVRYAMHSLREVSRITTGPFCDLVKESMIKPVEGEIDAAEWDSLRSLFMKVLRDAFHAFSLGDGELAQRAIDREAALEKSITVLRARFLKKKSGDDSGFLNFVTVEGRLARAALDMVRGDITL
jgi:Na+/phosphate symporter